MMVLHAILMVLHATYIDGIDGVATDLVDVNPIYVMSNLNSNALCYLVTSTKILYSDLMALHTTIEIQSVYLTENLCPNESHSFSIKTCYNKKTILNHS